MTRGANRRLAATLLPLLLAVAGPALAGQETTVDGVLHVSSAEPREPLQTWRLEEAWRVGGEDDEVLFGVVAGVQVDEEGNLYLLDSQLSEIKVYSPDGEFLRMLSREGEGPGETRNPNGLVLLPDGNLAMTQAFPGKVTVIDREGNPAGGFTIGSSDPTQGGFSILQGVRCGGDNLVFGLEMAQRGEDQQSQRRVSSVTAFGLDGSRGTTYTETAWTLEFQNLVIDDTEHMGFGARRFAVGPDGRVYTAPERDRYLIEVYAPDGKLDRVIERPCTPRKRTDEETALLRSFFEAAVRNVPIPVTINLGETEPVINWFLSGLQLDAAGDLWVMTDPGTQDQPEGVMQTFDVFDPQGHLERQVAIACPGDPDQDALFFAGPDRLILVTGFVDAVRSLIGGGGGGGEDVEEEPAPMEVVCYRVAERS